MWQQEHSRNVQCTKHQVPLCGGYLLVYVCNCVKAICFLSCFHTVDVTLSSDFMTGFCGETEEEHRDTISLMKLIKFDMAYMFAYSMRKVCCSFCSWPLFN